MTVFTVSAADDVSLGNEAFENGDYRNAIEYYQRAIDKKKQSELYINLGHAYSRLGYWKDAIAAYQSSLSLDKEASVNSQTVRFLAKAQYMDDQFENALINFRKIYKIEGDIQDKIWITRCFVSMRQWVLAERMALDFLEDEPENSEVLELLAYIFTNNNQAVQAVDIYKQLAKSQPDHTKYLLELANTYVILQQYEDAIAALQVGLFLPGNRHEEILRLLADLYMNQKIYHDAIICYTRLIALGYEVLPEDYFRLGYACYQTNELHSAQDAFSHILEENPLHIKANLYMGFIAEKQGQLDKAREYYMRAIESDLLSPEPHVSLANLELKNRQYEKSAEHYSQAIKLGDNKLQVHYNHVLSLLLNQHYPQALSALKNAFRHHPLNTNLNSLLETLAAE